MMMKNYNQSAEINHNPNWPYFYNQPNRILVIGVCVSGKTNVLGNLTKRPVLRVVIYASKIHFNQSIPCLLMGEKK